MNADEQQVRELYRERVPLVAVLGHVLWADEPDVLTTFDGYDK